MAVTGDALRIAAGDLNLARVQRLLDDGHDPNGTDPWGRTALQLAVRYAFKDEVAAMQMVQTLLAAGAELDAADDDGFTPLWHAAIYSYPSLLKFLIAAGADVNRRDPDGQTVLGAIDATPAFRNRRRRVVKLLEQASGVR